VTPTVVRVASALALLVAVGLAVASAEPDGHPRALLSHAHADVEPGTPPAPAAGPASLVVALGILALAGAGRRVMRRRCAGRVVPASLAVVLALFALESAEHSVHHLGDPDAASACVVLCVSQHVTGAEGAGTAVVGLPAPLVSAAPPITDQEVRPLLAYRPFEGRAPPAALPA